MQRRAFLQRVLCMAASAGMWPQRGHSAEYAYAPVVAGTTLQFPRDHGAHLEHRIEWWYLTGWLDRSSAADTPPCGFQVTFFRVRTPLPAGVSRFTPTQLLFAHAAVSDPRVGHILHDERAARAGFGLAQAAVGDTDVLIRDWRLQREPSGAYRATIRAQDFALQLDAVPAQAVLLQGHEGYSRKGPLQEHASYYYSVPQLRVSGNIVVRGHREAVTGRAWLDHEWSSTLMPPQAAGWDWLGLNLDDGGAIMAFRMRSSDATAPPVWADARIRDANGLLSPLDRTTIAFTPERHWTSPQGGRYPVQTRITVGAQILHVRPLFDAQEITSHSMGNTYWEGAVTAYAGGGPGARRLGRGYWELTGYRKPQRL